MGSNNLLKLEEHLCFKVYKSSMLINRAYIPLLKKLDLTYLQYIIMLVLWEQELILVKDICKILNIDTGTVSPVLKNLEKKLLINKIRDTKDERKVFIKITQKGLLLKSDVSKLQSKMIELVRKTCNNDSNFHIFLDDFNKKLLENIIQ